MIASGKSEGTCCKVPFKKDLMIRRLSPSEVGILFIHSVQGTSRSFPTYRGMLYALASSLPYILPVYALSECSRPTAFGL